MLCVRVLLSRAPLCSAIKSSSYGVRRLLTILLELQLAFPSLVCMAALCMFVVMHIGLHTACMQENAGMCAAPVYVCMQQNHNAGTGFVMMFMD